MGIANTTASAALVAVFTGLPVAAVTGRGTGIGDVMLEHKIAVIARALERHAPSAGTPMAALGAVGGLEHAAIAGFLLRAAALRTPVVLDGVIACSAALAAQAVAPAAADYWIAGHRSSAPGVSAALAETGPAAARRPRPASGRGVRGHPGRAPGPGRRAHPQRDGHVRLRRGDGEGVTGRPATRRCDAVGLWLESASRGHGADRPARAELSPTPQEDARGDDLLRRSG